MNAIDRRDFLQFALLASGAVATHCWRAEASPDLALPSSITIAPRTEPGERLIVTGRVVGMDDKPRPGVVIFAYHTDAKGLYRTHGDMPRGAADPQKFEGKLRTAADGTYRIDTIKPGAYPSRNNPAHIHFVIMPPGAKRQSDILWFDGDPLITTAMREKYGRFGNYSPIRVTTRDADGALHCTRDFKIGLVVGDER